MKHLIFILIIAFIFGCANVSATEGQQDINPHHYGNFNYIQDMPATRFALPSNLAEAEYGVPNIVRGRVGNDAIIVYQYNIDISNNVTIFPTHNRVSLEILEVIRGDLRVGETISILEPYFIERNTLFTDSNYMPSMPYHEYFFFLGHQLGEVADGGWSRPESFVGAYVVWRGEFGRHRVPESNMARGNISFSADELSLGTRANTDLYMSIWQEVIDAYMDWSRPAIPGYRARAGDFDLPHDFDMIMDMP